ncbi:hypothetical protein H0H92_007068 [Tricholoma furcatifolium]|nr:hypothetical protein H0H92_007068 [Tricholoma furcatifolium]
MPGKQKQVRFASTNLVHSPSSIPGLTISSLSPASSNAPLTPPSYTTTLPGPTPYTIGFPPSPLHTPPRLHQLLEVSRDPFLNFDLRQHPSSITSYHRGISMQALSEPATQPPMSSITITISHFPWSTTVYPSRRNTYVTVEDILDQVYHMLRTHIEPHDYYSLPNGKDKRRVTAAYEERYRRIPGSRDYEDEKRGGVRRVDFLAGQTKFLGFEEAGFVVAPY